MELAFFLVRNIVLASSFFLRADADIYWAPCPHGTIPADLNVINPGGGCVARVRDGNMVYSGKVPANNYFYAAYDVSYSTSDSYSGTFLPWAYDVLVYDDTPGTEIVWVRGEAHQVPRGAIIGGTALDLSPVYVARVGEYPAYYDPRESHAVYEYRGVRLAMTWDVLCLKYKLALEAGQYNEISEVVDRSDAHVSAEMAFVVDASNDTYVLANTDAQGFLHMIFSFPDFPTRQQMAFDVILAYTKDCSTLAWTWAVESECIPDSLRECSIALADQDSQFTSCLVTCVCVPTCDYVHVKYNAVPWLDQTGVAICEVELNYNTIDPPLMINNWD